MPDKQKHTTKRMLDVRSPMRDGVALSSDIWLPDSAGRYPLILLRTPYLKVSPPPPALQYPKLAAFFAEKGYAVAVQDVRGRGDSEGEYDYYFQEAEDGYDAIEWMAAQPWCDGRVGMMGVSYLGAVQWFAASQKPPHLVCIAATASPGDFFNEIPYVGGAFLQNRLWWSNFVAGRVPQTNIGDHEWADIFKHRPLLTADDAMGRKIPLYRQWLEHSTLDEYWKRLRLSGKEYKNIEIPALHVTGWFDSNQPGVMYHWLGMAQSSPAAGHQYLIVGPWDHAQTFFGGATKVGEMELSADSIIDVNQVHLDFFERYLKQTASHFNCPRARLYVTGRNAWQDFDAYPVRDATVSKLYLSSQGRANSMFGDGRLGANRGGEEPQDEYEFDPRNPVPLDPFNLGGVYGVDRRALERRDDVLVYTGEVLKSPIDVIGPVYVELYAASDARDTDFTASILDVYPDGRAVVLGARVVGIVRARYRNSFEKTELLTPGEVAKYQIDLGHIAHAFMPGHRIRLEVSSSAAPMYNPNQNTGNPIATDTEWRTARQIVYHNAQYPSALILPVVIS
jgi:uncharacterized protein